MRRSHDATGAGWAANAQVTRCEKGRPGSKLPHYRKFTMPQMAQSLPLSPHTSCDTYQTFCEAIVTTKSTHIHEHTEVYIGSIIVMHNSKTNTTLETAQLRVDSGLLHKQMRNIVINLQSWQMKFLTIIWIKNRWITHKQDLSTVEFQSRSFTSAGTQIETNHAQIWIENPIQSQTPKEAS